MNFDKVRTMAEMAEIYKISEDDFREQIEDYKTSQSVLSRQHFRGKLFPPKHQLTIIKFLGALGNSESDVLQHFNR